MLTLDAASLAINQLAIGDCLKMSSKAHASDTPPLQVTSHMHLDLATQSSFL
jgi:hypothetical protein